MFLMAVPFNKIGLFTFPLNSDGHILCLWKFYSWLVSMLCDFSLSEKHWNVDGMKCMSRERKKTQRAEFVSMTKYRFCSFSSNCHQFELNSMKISYHDDQNCDQNDHSYQCIVKKY